MRNCFVFGSSAFTSIPNTPTLMVITQWLKICNLGQHDTTKTIITAKQSGVSFKQCISVTYFSSFERKSSFFMITFALGDIKYFNLGTLVSEDLNQIDNIQDFTMNFKQYFKDQPTIVSITTTIEKNFPFFSFIY